MIDVKAKSALQLAVMMQGGAVTASEVAEATLAMIGALEDRSVFLSRTVERARREAAASDDRLAAGRVRGPLDGVPVAWKDLFDQAGEVTMAGSVVLADDPPAARDAIVVERLKAAGMVSVGRLNMTEFAFSGIGINPHYGTAKNAASRDVPRIPGGSSSGSAVAVAAGLVPVAIGSDTGGSVRIPAAFNGIVGYKATRGRYPMTGVYPLADSLDSLGVLSRTVEDAVLVDAALCGLVAPLVQRGSVDAVSFIVPTNIVFDGAEPEVVAAFEAAVARLTEAGAVIIRKELTAMQGVLDLYAQHGPLVTAECFARHEKRLNGADAARMDRRVVERARLGVKTTMADYVAILAARKPLMDKLLDEVGDAFILFPTLPHVAPPIAELDADDATFFAANAKTLRNTLIGNFLDWCGVSIPCGTGAAGMPVGCLISGLPDEDEALLSVALAAEELIRP